MKINLVEPKEDDPIFRSGFVVSPITTHSPKKSSESLNRKRELKKEEENKTYKSKNKENLKYHKIIHYLHQRI